ncbi:MAG: phosphotransferase, partial [Planctomycetota bacterium]
QESRALDLYAEMAADNPELIGSGTLALNPERNLLAIGWVEGEPFSHVLARARHEDEALETARMAMGLLGRYLAELRRRTVQPGAEIDPFHFEYLEYCSRRLRGIPLLGRLAFRRAVEEAEGISEAYRAARPVPSAAHGDFVFRNIHVSGNRVGLIDFANSLTLSHPLNDFYNLNFGLQNTVLSLETRSGLWDAFLEGLGGPDYPQAVHRFHFEWHRRRWLMLKILGPHPRDWIQAVRGMGSFARTNAPEALAR